MSIKKRIPRHSVAAWLLFLLPLGYMLLSLGLFDVLVEKDYDTLWHLYDRAFPHAFDIYTVAAQSFTEGWHAWLGWHKGPALLVLEAMPIVYLIFSRRVLAFCDRLVREVKRGGVFLAGGLRGCSGAERGGFFLLMGAVLAYRLYFYFANPLQTDELCSYLYFVRPGFFISITSYPIPNNHVFFSACCSLLNLVPGLSVKAVMRLPAVAGDVFLLYSIFCLVRRWGGYGRAMVTLAGVAFCYLTSYYAVQGRGYQWMEVCSLVSMAAGWECFYGPGRGERRGYALFIAASVAGFYINPGFVYHFTSLVFIAVFYSVREKDRKGLLIVGRTLGIVGAALAVLYMPLILCSSWRALTANYFVTGTSYANLFAHYRDLAFIVKDITYYDVPGLCFMLLCAAGLYIAYRRKVIGGVFYDWALVYIAAMLVSLMFWILYKRVFPLERGLCFQVMVINLVFVNACYDLFRVWFVRRWYAALAILLLVKIGGSVRGMYWQRWGFERQPDAEVIRGVEKDIRELDGLHPSSWQIMNSDDFYPMYLQEYLLRMRRKGEVIFSRGGVDADVLFVPDGMSLLFPSDRYMIWGEGRPASDGRKMKIYIAKRLVR